MEQFTTTKWLIIEKLPRQENKKTDIFDVYSKDQNIIIGKILWWGGWRQYIFAPNENTIYERQCLKDISDFLNKLLEERKIKK